MATSGYIEESIRQFTAGAAIGANLRVKLTAGKLAVAGASDIDIGTLRDASFADGDERAVILSNADGTQLMVASEAITLGDPVYAAASGKVAASGSVRIGYALCAASANNDVIEVLRLGQGDIVASVGGTTGAAFLVDSDATIPKIELASQTGGTGDYKVTIKPAATLTANRVVTIPDAATQVMVGDTATQTLTNKTISTGTLDLRPAATVTPAADGGAGSQITAGVTQVDVAAVTNDANDWILLPAIAGVAIGHTIRISCNAGTNFELRTPASSNTKINDVDSDGTQEYLCTDTDLVIVTKRTTTGWVAQSITKLGAVRTAVIPD